MPVSPTYPGVYIQEIPSGVHTITGVATSITAFIGRALSGPVNEATLITSYADFERGFGKQDVNYPMSYAVRDFYLNGGSQAIIVRLFLDGAVNAAQATAAAAQASNGPGAADVAAAARAKANTFTADPGKTAADAVAKAAEVAAAQNGATLAAVKTAAAAQAAATTDASTSSFKVSTVMTLWAASPGKWGDSLAIKIDYNGITQDVADRLGLDPKYIFNLSVVMSPPAVPSETFLNVSLHPDAGARRLDRVLAAQSNLIAFPSDSIPTADKADRPAATPADQDPTSRATAKNKLMLFSGGAASLPLDPATYIGSQSDKSGIFALENADLFNLLCIPADARGGDTDVSVYQAADAYCAQRRALLIVDSPAAWNNSVNLLSNAATLLTALGIGGDEARNAAIYYPRVIEADPLRDGQSDVFVPCGIIAGVMARTDVARGVWKAPAGVDASLNGIQGLEVNLTDMENGVLNPLGINVLRSFPIVGRVVWGARTMRGADQLADEYKYVPVRRLALFLEESLYRGTKWVVFEPNDDPLWSQIRLNLGAFMHNLFVQGAFQGKTPQEAYFVKCDNETTTQNDIDLGIVNIIVGFAPLKPAEFVIISLQQIAGQIQV